MHTSLLHWVCTGGEGSRGEIPLLCMEFNIAGQLKEKETNKKNKSFLISLIWVMSFLAVQNGSIGDLVTD